MRLVVPLLPLPPGEMEVFQKRKFYCYATPQFYCGDQVWPNPAPGWKVEINADGDLIAVMEVPDAVDGKELQVAPQ